MNTLDLEKLGKMYKSQYRIELKDFFGEDTINRVLLDKVSQYNPDDINEIRFLMHSGREVILTCDEVQYAGAVWIEDVNGSWEDLYDTPLLIVEERCECGDDPEDPVWTFYTFRTIKGSVDVRWCGEAPEYYSPNVEIKFKNLRGELWRLSDNHYELHRESP